MTPSSTSSASALDNLKSGIEKRTTKVGVIGLGYVGLPLALLFSEQNFTVCGFDIDRQKVQTLNRGESYIYRLPPAEIQAARTRNFTATADFSQIGEMDAIIICVPTPLTEHKEPDLSYIEMTARSIAPHVRKNQLIVLQSTTYPGTTDEILAPILESGNGAGLRCSRDSQAEVNAQVASSAPHRVEDPKEAANRGVFYVAFSPEREEPGNETVARRDIPKVVGGMSAASGDLAEALYGAIFAKVVRVSTPAAAEMTKLLENIYRSVNIALVNELKMLCLRMGIDIWEVISAASTKPYGFQPFYPGPGLGGHCIPIDPFYLSWKAREWDFQTRFIELAGEINTAMPHHVCTAVGAALNSHRKAINGAKILVLGAAYKRDIDDLRESPSLTIIELLRQSGAEVSYNDPYIPFIGRGRQYSLEMASTGLDKIAEFDCVVIVTDHSAYDFAAIVRESQLVVDTRNATRGEESDKIWPA